MLASRLHTNYNVHTYVTIVLPRPFFSSLEIENIKTSARSEDRTHDLQIALTNVIMRLTRYLLRYPGTCGPRHQDDTGKNA